VAANEFLLGMGQMLVEGGDAAGNLGRAVRMIREAAQRGCHIVVLPECLDLGWTFPGARELAKPIPGDSVTSSARRRARPASTWQPD
jgi:predicted amidohydrolase